MAHVTNNNFVDAKEISETKTKNQAKAFMSWEVVNSDGTRILDEEGNPYLRSDKDIPFWQNPNFKSVAEDTLIALAKGYAERSDGDPLELTMKVKIKPYIPKERLSPEDLFAALGIFKTM